MSREQFKVGDFIQHFKREDNPEGFNHCYKVIAVNAMHTETGERFLVYQSVVDTTKVYVRPMEMAMSEVDKEKYPNYQQTYRLEKIADPILWYNIVEELKDK